MVGAPTRYLRWPLALLNEFPTFTFAWSLPIGFNSFLIKSLILPTAMTLNNDNPIAIN